MSGTCPITKRKSTLTTLATSDHSATQPPAGLSRTFYKRELSEPSIPFSSQKGREIFQKALAEGTCNSFFPLIEQYKTQDEPAFCGLASIAMVLNTLSIDARRTWKGPWRWFHEEMLDCCNPLESVKEHGITLQEAACLARCNGAKVDVSIFGSFTLDEFREWIQEACSSSQEHIIVSYSRAELRQTGDGHFSPIGAYSATEDSVLVLDTARFKYPPHWISTEILYRAMARIDPVTGKPRGLMRLGMHPRMDSVLFTLDVRGEGAWHAPYQWLTNRVRSLSRHHASAGRESTAAAAAAVSLTPQLLIQNIIKDWKEEITAEGLTTFLAMRTVGSSCHGGVCTQTKAIETFLKELRMTPLYAVVSTVVPSTPDIPHIHTSNCASGDGLPWPAVAGDLLTERMCMMVLLGSKEILRELSGSPLEMGVAKLLDTTAYEVVGIEVEYVLGQLAELPGILTTSEQEEVATM